jgi:hypothetical protein
MIMNKKNMFFMAILMVFSTASVLPVQQLTQEEQLRCEYLRHLSQANALGIAQYCENGLFSNVLVERDVAILVQDNLQVIKSKNWAEGYFYSSMIPVVGKSVTVGSGLGTLIAGIGTSIGSVCLYNVWNSSFAANKAHSLALKTINAMGSDFPERLEKIVNSYDVKAQYLMQQSDYNNAVLRNVPIVPMTLVATLILAAVYTYSSRKLSNYNNRNAAFIKEMQGRYNNNLVAIAQLQQIAYDANFSS